MRIGLKALWILITLMAVAMAVAERHGAPVVIIVGRAGFVGFLIVGFLTTSFQGSQRLAVLGLMAGIGVLVVFAAKWLVVLVPSLLVSAVLLTWWRSRQWKALRLKPHRRTPASVE